MQGPIINIYFSLYPLNLEPCFISPPLSRDRPSGISCVHWLDISACELNRLIRWPSFVFVQPAISIFYFVVVCDYIVVFCSFM